MFVRALELTSFRSWKELALRLEGRCTVFTGGNGTGKTSVLEALWYAAALGSHRTSADAGMVREGSDSAIVRADVERGTRTERVELEIVTKGRPRSRLGGAPVARRRDVLGVLRAQIFAPERLAVVRGDPSERRRFADEILVQLHPRYHGVIAEYERALRQRNALLRDRERVGDVEAALAAWDEALVPAGAELSAGRAHAVAALAPHAARAFGAVGGGMSFEVSYAPNVPAPQDGGVGDWADAMRARLEERRRDELVRGTTLVGPHRDEVSLTLAGMPARTHASHGESWLSAMALVLGARAALAEAVGDEPVLLLDDPFTLLDPDRRGRLIEALPREAQILATAADPGEIPPTLEMARVDVAALRT